MVPVDDVLYLCFVEVPDWHWVWVVRLIVVMRWERKRSKRYLSVSSPEVDPQDSLIYVNSP